MSKISGADHRTALLGILRWLILAMVLVAGGIYVQNNQAAFTAVFALKARDLALLGLLGAVNILLLGWLNLLLVKALGVHLRYREATSLVILTTVANLILPLSGGALGKGAYFWRVHKLEPTRYVLSLAVVYALNTWLAAVVGGVCLLVSGSGGVTKSTIAASLSVLVLGLTVVLVCPAQKLPNLSWRAWQQFRDGWQCYQQQPGLLAALLAVQLANTLVLAGHFQVCGKAMGFPGGWVEMVGMSALQGFLRIINLTPGNLGVYEFGTGGLATLFGLPLEFGTLTALLSRTVTVLVVFSLAGPAWWYLNRHSKTALGK